MFAKGNSVSSDLKCDRCGHQLVETARDRHPRLPLHEIRVYVCRACGFREWLSAPLPHPDGMP
jgi:ribosomal protein L37E